LAQLSDFVKCGEEYRKVVNGLFFNAFVVENIDCALGIWTNSTSRVWLRRNRLCLSPLTATVVDYSGFISGGSLDSVGAGILERKREIKDLYLRKEGLDGEFKTAEDGIYRIAAETELAKNNIERMKESYSELCVELAGMSKEYEACQEEQQAFRAETFGDSVRYRADEI